MLGSVELGLPYRQVLWIIALGFCAHTSVARADFACDSPVIDAGEVARTPIAKRLVKEGFLEDPPSSGIYKKKQVTLKWLRKTFRLPNTKPVPSACVDSWVSTTRIEGNHTVLEAEGGTLGEVSEDSPLSVTVNLGYARPRQVCLGMPFKRVAEALELIKKVKGADSSCATFVQARKGWVFSCYLLPDATGLVVGKKIPERKPGAKPVTALTEELLVGEKGKGFRGWNRQKKTSLKKLAIQPFRKSASQ